MTISESAGEPTAGLLPAGAQLSTRDYISRLWGRVAFMVYTPFGEIPARPMDTVCGSVWHLLNPMLGFSVYWLISGQILKADHGVENYIAFLTVGICVFGFIKWAISQRTLRDVLALKSAREFRLVQAVRGVDLEVRSREAIGIIGANGSGKSTLLRAIVGLLPVIKGRVLVRSEPTLLDVGPALKGTMSGARNIYVGGLALGMTRRQVEERFDDIVAFAELEDFIDLPMRNYSSGIRARLRFSIASAVTPEILLIDEALAVGDRRFRKKSLNRVPQLVGGTNTVVMVTHNLGEVQSTCSRAIWLDSGRIHADGPPDEVISAYESGDAGGSG